MQALPQQTLVASLALSAIASCDGRHFLVGTIESRDVRLVALLALSLSVYSCRSSC